MAAVAEPSRPAWRPRKHLWAALGLLIVGGLGVNAIADWRDTHGLLINSSESLPNWMFVIHKTQAPARGDYVFFVAPADPLVVRHFGSDRHLFGKIVYGMPGETVAHRGAEVVVAGRVVGRMKPLTRTGEPLVPGPTGTIPRDCYYVGTPHKDGLDSRYAAIGFVCAKNIAGTGFPVL